MRIIMDITTDNQDQQVNSRCGQAIWIIVSLKLRKFEAKKFIF